MEIQKERALLFKILQLDDCEIKISFVDKETSQPLSDGSCCLQ